MKLKCFKVGGGRCNLGKQSIKCNRWESKEHHGINRMPEKYLAKPKRASRTTCLLRSSPPIQHRITLFHGLSVNLATCLQTLFRPGPGETSFVAKKLELELNWVPLFFWNLDGIRHLTRSAAEMECNFFTWYRQTAFWKLEAIWIMLTEDEDCLRSAAVLLLLMLCWYRLPHFPLEAEGFLG